MNFFIHGYIWQNLNQLLIGGFATLILAILTMSTMSIHQVLRTTTMPTMLMAFLPIEELFTLNYDSSTKYFKQEIMNYESEFLYKGDFCSRLIPNMLNDMNIKMISHQHIK